MKALYTIVLLFFSNLFMTYAWYNHLKAHRTAPMYFVILLSWGIAFFEYCLQVPANRIGDSVFTLPQLKVIQEVLSLGTFALLYTLWWDGKLDWNYAAAGVCLLGAVFFIFRNTG